MSFQMVFVLVMIVLMLLGLLFEVGRPDVVVFSVLVIFLITGILTPDEALKGFSNEGMITIALLFIVAGAIQKYGLIDQGMTRWLKKSRSRMGSMLRFFIPTALMSAFLNNTPIVVTFTPIIKKWCEDRGIAPSKFLIPLSYVTILGGTMTLMGTSTNLVVQGLLLDNGIKSFNLFTLTPVGVVVAVVGLLFIFLIGIKLLPEHKGFEQKVREDSREYLAEMRVDDSFPYVNQSIDAAGLRKLKGLYLIEIIRGEERLSPVRSSTIIQAGDRLIFTGLISTIVDLQSVKGLTLETGTHLELDDLKKGSSLLVEAVVSHNSSLLSKTIKKARFRSNFDAGVIAVHRNNERIKSKVGDISLKAGDTLLLLAGSDFIRKYQESSDFYVVSSIDTPDRLNRDLKKGLLSIGILVVMIALVTLGFLSMFKAMALATFLLLATRLITPVDAKKYIQFDVLLLIASSFGVGSAMTTTGLAKWLADGLIAIGQPMGLFVILIMVYLLTNIFTELITNSAAAVLMIPIGLQMADTLHVSPLGFAVLIAIGASASFITPIGYQTNLIVYGPGGYRFKDYVKIGVPLSLVIMMTTVVMVYWIYF
ncbi:SLC13 family permease [Pullulanibacillus sp. KACC 23026]|uniref:SLC13 family permease n=1 Tax=Pullulanibacillus sp. KACC 23026 TaxID=3028315 RepID=UPI0023AF1787|nr:SLC13 family permease [Pullulanibacillus sp. KACC 23026]WEG13513.1 SLC13 family permease [Pullulanibacillus sp. KACC 23026]